MNTYPTLDRIEKAFGCLYGLIAILLVIAAVKLGSFSLVPSVILFVVLSGLFFWPRSKNQ